MARCPFAVWKPVKYDGGAYTGGPFRIVHHTTEGSTAAGAFAVLHEDAPHFLVDHSTIWQMRDTARAAASMRHNGPPETNRLSAVQIEVVGFAGRPKDPMTLLNVARLCRWIEAEHGVPRVWPSGYPKPAVNGKDPGHHNRDPHIWATQGGHYGHCHAPSGNIHWDPGYTREEADLVVPPIETEDNADSPNV